jgi:hypothetical protein
MTFILEQADGEWKLGGMICKPWMAAGHDGLWYWTAGRAAAKKGESWTAWLYLTLADRLLTPMDGMTSSNRDKLHGEIGLLHMPEISAAQPLMIEGGSGASVEKYTITSLATDDAFGGLDVVVRVTATDVSDAAAARQRNLAVMAALLAARPELRAAFHGLWVFADAPGQAPYAIEQTMAQLQ